MDERGFDFEANGRLCKSASETLGQYIRQYDASKEMARSMTCKKRMEKHTPCWMMDSLRSDLSALDEEILLAKQLFPDESFNLSADDSLTTEELLMEHPLNTSFRTSSPEIRGQSAYLRVTDLQEEEFLYQERRSPQLARSVSSPSAENSTGVRYVRKFLPDDGRANGYHHQAGDPPPSRYTRSKISSDDIQGEITVSVNYEPRKQMRVGTENTQKEQSLDARLRCCQPERNDLERESNISVSLQLEGKPSSVREFMGECFAENSTKEKTPTKQPGERTVESLKNMLFSLQEISNNAKTELGITGRLDDYGAADKSGCESLEKAMKHLVILKNLVKEVGSPDKK